MSAKQNQKLENSCGYLGKSLSFLFFVPMSHEQDTLKQNICNTIGIIKCTFEKEKCGYFHISTIETFSTQNNLKIIYSQIFLILVYHIFSVCRCGSNSHRLFYITCIMLLCTFRHLRVVLFVCSVLFSPWNISGFRCFYLVDQQVAKILPLPQLGGSVEQFQLYYLVIFGNTKDFFAAT